ncbi:C-X-C motif chemokine 10-like [Conger conger]|nr:C-X-C motif chemokine 10-like [Conger conger]
MEFTLKTLGLFLAAVLCLLLSNVQEGESIYIPARCACPESNNFIRDILIADFTITEKGTHCKNDEIIVTLKKDNLKVCLNAEGKQGQNLISCWNRIHKNENEKTSCLRRRKPQNK